jgi:para-aminobenzoate synthetase component II
MVVMIDNFDSFTYNLVQYVRVLHKDVAVFRNDVVTIEKIRDMNPEIIIISPGPCTPERAGISLDVVTAFVQTIPILGICLGHQTIGQALGGRVVKAKRPVHGKVHSILHTGKGVFAGLKSPLNVTRYHSLVLERESLPDDIEITAETSEGEIMGIRHRCYPCEGVQFHPEAILTEGGMELLANFVRVAKETRPARHA